MADAELCVTVLVGLYQRCCHDVDELLDVVTYPLCEVDVDAEVVLDTKVMVGDVLDGLFVEQRVGIPSKMHIDVSAVVLGSVGRNVTSMTTAVVTMS